MNNKYLTYELIEETLTSLGFEHHMDSFVKSIKSRTYYVFVEENYIQFWCARSGYKTNTYVKRYPTTYEEILFERISKPKRDIRTFDELIEVIKCLK